MIQSSASSNDNVIGLSFDRLDKNPRVPVAQREAGNDSQFRILFCPDLEIACLSISLVCASLDAVKPPA